MPAARAADPAQGHPGPLSACHHRPAAGQARGGARDLEAIAKEAPAFIEAHVTLATVYYRLQAQAGWRPGARHRAEAECREAGKQQQGSQRANDRGGAVALPRAVIAASRQRPPPPAPRAIARRPPHSPVPDGAGAAPPSETARSCAPTRNSTATSARILRDRGRGPHRDGRKGDSPRAARMGLRPRARSARRTSSGATASGTRAV